MTEVNLWDSIRTRQLAGLDPHRIENGVRNACPDVNYSHGWIELKVVDKFPMHVQTPVLVPKLRDRHGADQVAWMKRRWAADGLVWLWVRVGASSFVFDGWISDLIRNGVDSIDFRSLAILNSLDKKDVIQSVLKGDMEAMPKTKRARFLRAKCMKDRQWTAAEIGWPWEKLVLAETMQGSDTDDLLEFWEA